MGRRLGSHLPKALVPVSGTPLLVATLRAFDEALLEGAVIVVPQDHEAAIRTALNEAFPKTKFLLTQGGEERQDSVRYGLTQLNDDTEIVIIHDAARPFVSQDLIRNTIKAAKTHAAATAAIPCTDTILEEDGSGFLLSTPQRSGLWACQTPQTFKVDVIRHAHDAATRGGYTCTDDATLVHRNGGKVRLVEGDQDNIKITTPADLAFAEYLFEKR